jgi:succinate dehydrogenase flavin-adding protein (antitoxin of CptAB toxin-antitoxin module)
MSLAEILEELPKLTEEERDELRSRLDEYDPGLFPFFRSESGASNLENAKRSPLIK